LVAAERIILDAQLTLDEAVPAPIESATEAASSYQAGWQERPEEPATSS
jgi:hypothetical protein